MALERRRFLQLIGGVFFSPVIPAFSKDVTYISEPHVDWPQADSLPTLYADGLHDDAPALQALIHGEAVNLSGVVSMEGAGVFGDKLVTPRGKFRVDRPVVLGKEFSFKVIDFNGSSFRPYGSSAFTVDADFGTISICHFSVELNDPVSVRDQPRPVNIFFGDRAKTMPNFFWGSCETPAAPEGFLPSKLTQPQ